MIGREAGRVVQTAMAGLADVDAITLSMAQMARDGGALPSAAIAIVVAATANTIVKCGIVLTLGSRPLKARVLLLTASLLAVAATLHFL